MNARKKFIESKTMNETSKLNYDEYYSDDKRVVVIDIYNLDKSQMHIPNIIAEKSKLGYKLLNLFEGKNKYLQYIIMQKV